MRGELTFKILSALEKNKDEALDLLSAFLVAGIAGGNNPKKMQYLAKTIIEERQKLREDKEQDRMAKHRFYSMVSYLEKDGLVKKQKKEEGIYINITSKGITHLRYIKERTEYAFPPPNYDDDLEKVGNVTIITFDVPEIERKKRDWLRCALRNMDSEMIHKSVWMCQNGIPEGFLEDIRDLNLSDYMEIFQINKKGTLARFDIKKSKK